MAFQKPFRGRCRFFNGPPDVIWLSVMLLMRYPRSLRRVEDILRERGNDLCLKSERL
jgi:transposase-like protein